MATTYNAYKARNVMMYVAWKAGSRASHQLWPVLYLAERRHLATTGQSLLGDIWVAMRHGPVPLRAYAELCVWSAGHVHAGGEAVVEQWLGWLGTRAAVVDKPDCLRPWEVDCLEWAVEEAARLGMTGLQHVTRGPAWEGAGLDGEMDPLLIAQEAGANAATLDCILSWRGGRGQALSLP